MAYLIPGVGVVQAGSAAKLLPGCVFQIVEAASGPVIGTTSVSANLGTESASTVNKTAAAGIASDIDATAANTQAKIALVSLDAALCAEASITATPVSAVSASVAAVLGIEQGETSTKLAIAALSAALGMESANTYQKVEAGVGVTTVAISLGFDGTVSAVKLSGSSLASDIAADINAVTAKVALSSVTTDGAIYGTVTAAPYTPPVGVTLSPEDIAAIADAVWAHSSATSLAANIAAAVIAAASATPINANVQKINDADVVGTGTSSDLWRGL